MSRIRQLCLWWVVATACLCCALLCRPEERGLASPASYIWTPGSLLRYDYDGGSIFVYVVGQGQSRGTTIVVLDRRVSDASWFFAEVGSDGAMDWNESMMIGAPLWTVIPYLGRVGEESWVVRDRASNREESYRRTDEDGVATIECWSSSPAGWGTDGFRSYSLDLRRGVVTSIATPTGGMRLVESRRQTTEELREAEDVLRVLQAVAKCSISSKVTRTDLSEDPLYADIEQLALACGDVLTEEAREIGRNALQRYSGLFEARRQERGRLAGLFDVLDGVGVRRAIGGATVDFSALSDQVVLVHWFRACGWCKPVLPQIASLEARLHQRGVDIVSVTSDQSDGDSSKVAGAFGFAHPIVRDALLAKHIGMSVAPTIIAMDRRRGAAIAIVGCLQTTEATVLATIDQWRRP